MVKEFDNVVCTLKIADDYYSATMTLIFNSKETDSDEEPDSFETTGSIYDGVLDFIKEVVLFLG